MFSLPLSVVFGSITAHHLLGKYCLALKSGFLSCEFNLLCLWEGSFERVSHFETLQSLSLQMQRCILMVLGLILVLPILAGRGLQHSLRGQVPCLFTFNY